MGDQEETIFLKLPLDILEFTEFYARVCEEDEGELIRKVLIEKLSEIRQKFREIPHISIEIIWKEWNDIETVEESGRVKSD